MLGLALAAIVLAIGAADGALALVLSREGKTAYSIVIADRAIVPEQNAAKELQSYLKQVTGADFPVRTESQVSASDPQILVGQSRRMKKLAADVDLKSLGYDGIVIRTVGNNLILAGGQPRGSLYAVYTFLEDTVGCRWWTRTESYVPRKTVLDIPDLNTVYSPKIKYREAYSRGPYADSQFAVRMKLNGAMNAIPRDLGGHYSIIGWCHTAYPMLPPERYFKDHPEWYSLIGGKRVTTSPGGSQPCFMNEEMQKELTRVALEKIGKEPDAGIISISQNDCIGACECEKCKAVEAEDGSPAGPLLRCVNAVAAEIEKHYPDMLVETLAYQHTRKPPLVTKPRHNVVIRLCSIECNFAQALDSDTNAAFRDDTRKWAAIAQNLYIWNYVTNFANYITPHPSIRWYGSDLRFFAANHVMGVFEQGDAQTWSGDFNNLRDWLLAHLMWNPELDQVKLTAEFMNGYYGAAGPYLQKYLDVVQDSAVSHKSSTGFCSSDYSFMDFNVLAEGTRLFDKAAKAVASDAVLSARVRRDRMSLDQIWLMKYAEMKATAEKMGVPFVGPKDPVALADEFTELGRKYDAVATCSWVPFEQQAMQLKLAYYKPPTLEELGKLEPAACVVVQQNEFKLAKPGVWTKLVDDPRASDGKAVMLTTDHKQQAVQFEFSERFAKAHPGNWECFIVARCEDGGKAGFAIQYGFSDKKGGTENSTLADSMENAKGGQYRVYYLGAHQPRTGTYIWVAPCGEPDVAKSIHVDRIVMVRKD